MQPGAIDITMVKGASWRQRLTLKQAGAPPTARDLTGCEARMQVRLKAGASDPALISVSEVPSSDGSIALGGVDGTIDIYVSASATERLTGRRAAWDLFLEWPNHEDVDCVAAGTVTVRANVTEPTYD